MNAAGTLGFAPDIHSPVGLARLGAFVTNPISRIPRTPAKGTRYIPYPGGFLLHTGLPNPGLSATIRRFARGWVSSPLPVILHLLAENPDELAWMVERVERIEGVMGIEVGLPPGVDPGAAAQFSQAALGELPVIVRLPLEQCMELAQAVVEAGASLVSLGAPRGTLAPVESLGGGDARISGRLYGPAVFPQALRAVTMLTEAGIPVIGAGGVQSASDVDLMLKTGASAVQVGCALWRVGGAFAV